MPAIKPSSIVVDRRQCLSHYSPNRVGLKKLGDHKGIMGWLRWMKLRLMFKGLKNKEMFAVCMLL